jgi:hypothetical protein
VELQNKLGLCLLAHWLEEDGYLPEILCQSYKELIKSESARGDYLSKLPQGTLRHFRFMINNLHLPYPKLMTAFLEHFCEVKVEYATENI